MRRLIWVCTVCFSLSVWIFRRYSIYERLSTVAIYAERPTSDSSTLHLENTQVQMYRKFHLQKLKIFRKKQNKTKNKTKNKKNSDIFQISAQNIDCGYSFEPSRWGGSNEYPQSMFLSRNKKKYPCKPQFYYIKVGFKRFKIVYICFRDDC